MVLSCSSVHASACASRNIVNTSCRVFDAFCQTCTNDALWDRDECLKFGGQTVTVQGHGGMLEPSLYRWTVELDFPVRSSHLAFFSSRLHS